MNCLYVLEIKPFLVASFANIFSQSIGCLLVLFIQEEVKLSLLADDMKLYIENPKDTTRKLIELINEFSKVAGYKSNTQKSVAFLLTAKDQKEKLRKQSH